VKTIPVAAALGALLGCSEGPDRPGPAPPGAASAPPAVIPDSIRAFCGPPGAAGGDPLPDGAGQLHPAEPHEDQMSTLDAAVRCVLRTPAEWAAYRSAAGMGALPELGKNQVMLVAGSGWKPSTGYWIRIDTVAMSGRVVTAVVRAGEPPEESDVGALETSPVSAVLIPAPADSVVFLERP
jgi:protease stability complex PrcB-like protein